MEFAGEFETHLTIALGDSPDVEAIHHAAHKHGLKCLHIVLDRGSHTSQPMLSKRAQGLLSSELLAAGNLSDSLKGDGLEVSRIKIEAAPSNDDVPQTDDEAATREKTQYFEHHIKLQLDSDTNLAQLAELSERHGAHLSRNALRNLTVGRQERFVTQRCWSVGRSTARRRLTALLDGLKASGFHVSEVEEEYVVYDSNVAIDAGWIDSHEHANS